MYKDKAAKRPCRSCRGRQEKVRPGAGREAGPGYARINRRERPGAIMLYSEKFICRSGPRPRTLSRSKPQKRKENNYPFSLKNTDGMYLPGRTATATIVIPAEAGQIQQERQGRTDIGPKGRIQGCILQSSLKPCITARLYVYVR
jgi:hypothetical protein